MLARNEILLINKWTFLFQQFTDERFLLYDRTLFYLNQNIKGPVRKWCIDLTIDLIDRSKRDFEIEKRVCD